MIDASYAELSATVSELVADWDIAAALPYARQAAAAFSRLQTGSISDKDVSDLRLHAFVVAKLGYFAEGVQISNAALPLIAEREGLAISAPLAVVKMEHAKRLIDNEQLSDALDFLENDLHRIRASTTDDLIATYYAGYHLILIADVHEQLNEAGRALESAESAVEAFRAVYAGSPKARIRQLLAIALAAVARAYLMRNEPQAALLAQTEATEISNLLAFARTDNLVFSYGHACINLAGCFARNDRSIEADERFRDGIRILESFKGHKGDYVAEYIGSAHVQLATHLEKIGDPLAAYGYRLRAENIFSKYAISNWRNRNARRMNLVALDIPSNLPMTRPLLQRRTLQSEFSLIRASEQHLAEIDNMSKFLKALDRMYLSMSELIAAEPGGISRLNVIEEEGDYGELWSGYSVEWGFRIAIPARSWPKVIAGVKRGMFTEALIHELGHVALAFDHTGASNWKNLNLWPGAIEGFANPVGVYACLANGTIPTCHSDVSGARDWLSLYDFVDERINVGVTKLFEFAGHQTTECGGHHGSARILEAALFDLLFYRFRDYSGLRDVLRGWAAQSFDRALLERSETAKLEDFFIAFGRAHQRNIAEYLRLWKFKTERIDEALGEFESLEPVLPVLRHVRTRG